MNPSMMLVTQRDEFVQKSERQRMKDRNQIVAKYTDLAARVEKLQAEGSKPTGK